MSLGCWSGEPDNHSTINQVVAKLKAIITKNDVIVKPYNSNTSIQQAETLNNDNNLLHKDLSQLIQNFNNMNTKDTMISTSLSDQNVNKIKMFYQRITLV